MSKEIIQRLSQYKSVLYKMKSLGFVRVFSDNLGDALGVSASLVRKDFACFDLRGNKRGGYRIDDLIARLNTLLGKDEIQKVVVVGCGKIGTALMNHHGFARERIRVVAGFDLNHDIIDPNAPIPIHDVSELVDFIQREDIQIAIMTVPESATAQIVDLLLNAGIRGILNFAPVQLKGNDQCIVRNINIAMEIENLFSHVRFMQKNKDASVES